MARGDRRLYTVTDWLDEFGADYGLTTTEYILRCCRGDRMRTGHVCHLPAGWRAVRFGRTWAIGRTGKGKVPKPKVREEGSG